MSGRYFASADLEIRPARSDYTPVRSRREAGLRRKAMLEQLDRGATKPEAVRTALTVNPFAARDAELKAKLDRQRAAAAADDRRHGVPSR